ncbi:MAG: MoaD/ThiS family protein, partial [Planctomycetota bacterium]
MDGNTKVTVLAFGSAADLLGWPTREISLPAEATLASLVQRLEGEAPRLREMRGRLRFAVNEQYAPDDAP